ncbi:MAG: hypothetical protein JXR69_01735 [Candidatus Delongbacteria bacterium]|nr:hypothetical protein [Candidatus Delongbacteria bacterium]
MKNTYTKRVFALIFLILFGITFSGFGSTLTITFKDQSKQVVDLQKPSEDIMKFEFSGKSETIDKTITKTYIDKGKKIEINCGEAAFVTKVIDHDTGTRKPMNAAMSKNGPIGEPDYKSNKDSTYLTLGCGGSVVLEFGNVWLVDGEGHDLHVFEIGPAVEPMQLEISKDGNSWIDIGKISGGTASVDIHNYVSPGDKFRFIKLTDLKSDCGGNTPGADVDAAAAINCIPR